MRRLAILLCAAGGLPPVVPAAVLQELGTPPSPFGRLTSRRWACGQAYRRENLAPVPNPNPEPETQPHRDRPFDLVVSADGTKVYVGLQGSELEPGSEVAVYSLARDAFVRRIPLRPEGEPGPPGSSPYRLKLHPGGRFLVVTNRFSNFASVIDTQRDAVVTEIPLDFYCQDLVFAPGGRRAFVANRYLDQVFLLDVEAEGDSFRARLRVQGGLDEAEFRQNVYPELLRSCGTTGCHAEQQGGFVAGPDPAASYRSALLHTRPGNSRESRLLRATVRTRDGGYADRRPPRLGHAGGIVVYPAGAADPGYRTIAGWIDRGGDGPGLPVGNPRSKPKILALSPDGRLLFSGNTGTQDIAVLDAGTGAELGSIYVQNVVNDLLVRHDSASGRDLLIVTTEGVGFGVARERDPFGGESWDRDNPAAQYTVWRDLGSGRVLPKAQQEVLGPYDAVDGTAGIKFRDIQNDLVIIDLGRLAVPGTPPEHPRRLLMANRYEAHAGWVRYTSDTAESAYGDLKGDIPPDLMRVVGAMPEKMAVSGEHLFVTMQASAEVQEWRVQAAAADPADRLVPVATWPTGLQPIGIAAGPPGTPAEGLLFTANFMGGTMTVLDTRAGGSREVVIDPSVRSRPFPDSNAERGELFAHSALFSSDGDTSCFHCHYLDTGDGRPWGVSQVVGQEYLSGDGSRGQLVIGGTMGVPQMRALFAIQPFFFEGVISAFEPRSMIMEHAPADDFSAPAPCGDFTAIRAHYVLGGIADVQSSMEAGTPFAADLEERRDEMFRRRSMQLLGKAFTLRDFQRFVGEWQLAQPHLLPNPFDADSASVLRGRAVFEHPQAGCVSCHPPPHFAKKDLPDNPEQAFPPVVSLTARDAAFTLIGMNRLDSINGVQRDLEPWDAGRAEETQGHFTSLQLRGLWDRPPVFLHNGMARTLREVLCTPGHPALRRYRYEPLIGGVPERPGRREVGFNETFLFKQPGGRVRAHMASGARIGLDTHGGTSQLTALQIDDLVHFLESIE